MNIQTKAKIIGEYGCLAMCYIFCAGIKPDANRYFSLVSIAMDRGYLSNDCTVLDASKFINFVSGKKATVSKQQITSINQITQKTPVQFTYKNNSHWVVVENGKIVFNSLEISNCVENGNVTSARIIKF